jgi:coproporphyrinogen III oxidase
MTVADSTLGDTRLDRLSPEHQVVARRMIGFMDRADRKYFARAQAMNGAAEGAGPDDRLTRETDDSIYDVRVTRGPVIEKLGRMVAEGKKTQPGRREGELVWGRFYSIDVHPQTPLVGMLHATLVLQFYEDGTGFAGGWLGVMNGTRIEDDMQALTRVVDTHFAARDRNPAIYRRLIVKGTDDTVATFRRKPDPSGVSFYGPPVFPGDVARSYDLIEELFGKFTDAYLDLVAERAGSAVTADDVRRQEEMRKRWLVDQLFSDPFASELVPFEVWSLANVPPTIRF